MATVSSTDARAAKRGGAPDIAVLVEGLFSLVVKGARRIIQLSDQELSVLKRLMVAFADPNEAERGEIIETVLELLLPEDMIGGVVAEEEKTNGAARTVRSHVYVGRQIRNRRKELGLNQKDLAERAGIPQTHVSRLETGKHAPTHTTVKRLAEALEIDPQRLDPGYPEEP